MAEALRHLRAAGAQPTRSSGSTGCTGTRGPARTSRPSPATSTSRACRSAPGAFSFKPQPALEAFRRVVAAAAGLRQGRQRPLPLAAARSHPSSSGSISSSTRSAVRRQVNCAARCAPGRDQPLRARPGRWPHGPEPMRTPHGRRDRPPARRRRRSRAAPPRSELTTGVPAAMASRHGQAEALVQRGHGQHRGPGVEAGQVVLGHVAKRARAVGAGGHVGPGRPGQHHLEALLAERRRQAVQQRQVLARQVGAHGQHVRLAPGRSRAAHRAPRPRDRGSGRPRPGWRWPPGAGSTPRCSTIWSPRDL